MSTILKALRRVEGERQQKVETDRLHADVTGGTSSERRPLGGWIRLSLVLSLLLVVAAGFWSLGSDPSPDETPPVEFESEAAAPGLGAAADRIRSGANPSPSQPPPSQPPTALARGDRARSYSPSPSPSPSPAYAAAPVPSPSSVPVASPAPVPSSAPIPSSAPATASARETPIPGVALTDSDKRRNAAMQEAIRRRSAAAEWAPRAPRYEPPRTFVPAPPTESPAPEEVASSEPARDPTPEELSPYLAAREAARLKAQAEAEPIAMAQPKPSKPMPLKPMPSKPMPSKPMPSKPMPSKPMPNSQARAASAEAPRAEASEVETLRVVSTVWHPTPDKRVAVITLSDGGAPVQLRQGETLNGLRVSEIKLSSVVFESGDQTIVRKVGAKP